MAFAKSNLQGLNFGSTIFTPLFGLYLAIIRFGLDENNLSTFYNNGNGIFCEDPQIVSNEELLIDNSYQLILNYNLPTFETTVKFSNYYEEFTEISVYNLKGQKIKTLISEVTRSGPHSLIWDGKDLNNKLVPSGLYFFNFSSEHTNLFKKMILLK